MVAVAALGMLALCPLSVRVWPASPGAPARARTSPPRSTCRPLPRLLSCPARSWSRVLEAALSTLS